MSAAAAAQRRITILIALMLVLGACRNHSHETMPPVPRDTARLTLASDTTTHRPGL